ncbi:MAG: phosphoribosylglycinamide formyltransferase [Gammaproteobacteria bacterium]
MSNAYPAIVVLVSGRGSNLQAIIDSTQQDLPARIVAVISDEPEALALERARRATIPTHVVTRRAFSTREAFESALQAAIDAHQPALVVLAGFMRILTSDFVAHYQGKMINIHPSLLPAFPGLDTHARALAAGHRQHGASVHFVTAEVDGGPVIMQAAVPVLPEDTPAILAERVLEQEHRILPEAIRWFIERDLTIDGNLVLRHGKPVSLQSSVSAELLDCDSKPI